MTDINLIKTLREATGAGMMECKTALEQAGDDLTQAQEVLRKSGALKAAKKADRATLEGLVDIKISPDHKKGSIIQINCETDFVAKNDNFVTLVNELSAVNFETGSAEAEFNNRKEGLILKIGENLTFGRAEALEGEYVSGYLHANKKVGALVSFSQPVSEDLAHDISMQVTAANPSYLKPEDVPGDVIEKEKEIYREQLKNENKPENIMENIIKGKLAKFYEDNCLLNQVFIKDDKKHVKDLLPSGVELVKFVRYSL